MGEGNHTTFEKCPRKGIIYVQSKFVVFSCSEIKHVPQSRSQYTLTQCARTWACFDNTLRTCGDAVPGGNTHMRDVCFRLVCFNGCVCVMRDVCFRLVCFSVCRVDG